MTQQAGLQVLLLPIGIDDLTLVIHGHGVDGQVAALQVLLQGDRRIGMEGEAAVAVTTLALGSGQRVLLAGVRVQEYREVLPDRAEAGLQQLIRRGADHYPVAFMPGHAQQLVADGAADQIGIEVCFHGRSLGRGGVVLQGGMQPPIAGMEPGTPWKRRPAGSVEHHGPRSDSMKGWLTVPVDELVLDEMVSSLSLYGVVMRQRK